MNFLDRLYRRLGGAYVFPILAFAVLVTELNVVTFVPIGTRFLKLDAAVVYRILVLGVVGSCVGLALTFGVMLLIGRDLFAWMRGSKDPARAPVVWNTAVTAPARVVFSGCFLVSVCVLPAMLTAAREARLGVEQVYVLATSFAAIGAAASIILVAAEVWVRPVIGEIGASLPTRVDVPRAKQRPLARRLVAFVVLVSFLSAFYAFGLASQSPSTQGRVVGAMTAGAGIALTFGLLMSLAVARTVASPVRELVRATRDVRLGLLDTKVTPTANDEIGELARSFNDMVVGLSEREALHSALGTYVDPIVADRLLTEGVVLQGEEVDATIMFVDIVAYTTRAEDMDAQAVVAELNDFFQLTIPIINRFGGHTNKLLGDGFMAVFGAPVPIDDHADRALDAAHEIQREMRRRYEGGLRAGVGINSGQVVVGTTGGGSKLDFTVIGDAVNVASRIQALTRETGDEILMSESTRDVLTRGVSSVLARGSTPIKGRAAPVRIFAAITRGG
jgi:class 3 adenylate cyclase